MQCKLDAEDVDKEFVRYTWSFSINLNMLAGANAGFPRGGTTPKRAPTYHLIDFSQKLHEMKIFWTSGGGRVHIPYVT